MIDAASENLVLAFNRGDAAHAVRARCVRGVMPHARSTRVAGAPRQVVGVISWRGAVVPLIEPGEACGTEWAAAVIVAGELGDMALAADRIEGWIEMPDGSGVIDVDELQNRLRERIRRGRESERPRPDENNP